MLATLYDVIHRAQHTMGRTGFATEIAEKVARTRSDLQVDVHDGNILVRGLDGRQWSEDISRAHDLYLAEPRMRASLLTLTAASICDRAKVTAAEPAHAADLKTLLPIVCHRDTLVGSDAVFYPFARALALAFVLERPSAATLVTTDLQAHLTPTLRDLQHRAVENLDRRIDEVTIDSISHGVSLIASESLPASSLLFSRTFWIGSSLAREHTALCAIPADPFTIVVFDQSAAGARDRAVATAHEIIEHSREPLTPEIVAMDAYR